MKILTLLRHAKSDWSDPVTRDIDRPLNARGFKAARTVGRHMAELGLRFDTVLASPARRVRETIAGIEEGLGRSLDAQVEPRIYLATPEALWELVREQEEATSLLLVGHSPGLESLALQLAAPAPLRDEVEIKYPTAALAELVTAGESWADLAGADLARFVRPRDLDASLGPDD